MKKKSSKPLTPSSNSNGFGFGSPSQSFSMSRTSTPTLGGFSSMGALLNMESELEPNLVVIIKKTLKKDTQTKTKAAQELLDYVVNAKNEDLVVFLTYWPTIFNRIGLDYDKRVREIVASIHSKLVEKLSKQVAPILKSVIGTWISLTFDPFPSVSKIATSSFNSSFKDKRTNVLQFCFASLMEFLSEMLLEASPESLGDPRYQTSEEMMSKYSRVISCSFSTLIMLMTDLSATILDNSSEFKALLDDARLWGLCAHEDISIRRSFYTFIKCGYMVRSDEMKLRVELIAGAFFSKCFSEKDPSAHGELWEAILLALKHTPDVWSLSSTKKPLIGKLNYFLKNGAFGSVHISYPSLLPLLALIPVMVWSQKGDADQVLSLFESFWQGGSTIDITSSHVFVNSFLECILFITAKEGLITSPDTKKTLLTRLFFRPLIATLFPRQFSDFKQNLNEDKVNSLTATFFAKVWSLSSFSDEKPEEVGRYLEAVILQTLEEQMDSEKSTHLEDHELEQFCDRTCQFLISLGSVIKDGKGAPLSLKSYFEALVQNVFALTLNQLETDPYPGLDKLLKSLLQTFGKRLVHHQDTRSQLCRVIQEKLDASISDFLAGSSLPIETLFEALQVLSCTTKSYRSVTPTVIDETQMLWNSLLSATVKLETRVSQFRVLYYSFREANQRKFNGKLKLQVDDIDALVKSALQDSLDIQYFIELLSLSLMTDFEDGEMLDSRTMDTVKELMKSSLLQSHKIFSVENPASHEMSSDLIRQILFSLCVLRRIVENHSQQDSTDISHLSDFFGSIYIYVTEYAVFHAHSAAQVVFVEPPLNLAEGIPLLSRIQTEAIAIQKPMGRCLLQLDVEELLNYLPLWLKVWKSSYVNQRHCGSPSDFLQQIRELLDMTTSDPTKSDGLKKLIFQTVILDRPTWQFASLAFEQVNESVFTKDVFASFSPFLNYHISSSNVVKSYAKVAYDIDGLSLYARIALVTIGLVNDGLLRVGDDLAVDANHDIGAPGKESGKPLEDMKHNKLHLFKTDSSYSWLWVELARFKHVCQDHAFLRVPQGQSLWRDDVPLQLEAVADDVSQILEAQLSNQEGSLYEMAQYFLSRLAISKPSHDRVHSSLVAVSALDGLLLSTDPILRLSYGRALCWILSVFFTHNSFSWHESDMEIWFKAAFTAETDKKDNRIAAFGILVPLRDFMQTNSMGSHKVPVRNFVDSFLEMTRDIYEDFTSLHKVHYATLCLFYMFPMIVSYFKAENSDLDRNTFHQILTIIRTWYDSHLSAGESLPTPATRSADTIREYIAVDVVICRLIKETIDSKIDLSLNLARFIVELTVFWIKQVQAQDDIVVSPSHTALLIEVSQLWTALVDVVEDDEDHWSHVYEVEPSVTSIFIQIFAKVGQLRNISGPVADVQTILAHLLAQVPITEAETQELLSYDKLCEMLFTTNEEVQKVAYSLLARLTKYEVQKKSLAIEMDTSLDKEDSPFVLSPGLLASLARQDLIHDDQHILFGYFLSWTILFDNLTDATYHLKSGYVRQIRDTDLLASFLGTIFQVLDVGKDKISPFDLSLWDIKTFEIAGFDFESEQSMPLLASHLFWRSIISLPSLVRNWWSECRNRQLVQAVEKYTQEFFTPSLIQREVKTIQNKKSELPELNVKSISTANVVCAGYKIEESVLELVLRFPACFPLRVVEVESGKGNERIAGINEGRWRSWLLAISAVMTAHNGSAADAITLFHKNVSLHFEGLEDCAICYSIICAVDRTVPNKTCKTCKHSFHGSCLFKWFKSSNQSTCPLCRQVF